MSLPVFLATCLLIVAGPAFATTTVPVVITNASGRHTYRLELAETEAEQERGLMFRRSLEAKGGMIFPRTPPGPSFMWMKNTYIPLDIVFVGIDGRVNHLVNAEPFDETPVGTEGPVAAALELKAGSIAADHIAVGDRVTYAVPGS